jgi:hypothetical protein
MLQALCRCSVVARSCSCKPSVGVQWRRVRAAANPLLVFSGGAYVQLQTFCWCSVDARTCSCNPSVGVQCKRVLSDVASRPSSCYVRNGGEGIYLTCFSFLAALHSESSADSVGVRPCRNVWMQSLLLLWSRSLSCWVAAVSNLLPAGVRKLCQSLRSLNFMEGFGGTVKCSSMSHYSSSLLLGASVVSYC